MATPKTPKTKKIAQDVHTSERATLRNFFEKKAKKTNTKDLWRYAFFLLRFFLVALRFRCLFVV